ncbi:MAG: hypothetical protein LBR77_05725 [Lachnospiraceae bacterium]|jgi:hypothetical protein|nr:hypothetical protein [Lachnospiraceae bacterium]
MTRLDLLERLLRYYRSSFDIVRDVEVPIGEQVGGGDRNATGTGSTGAVSLDGSGGSAGDGCDGVMTVHEDPGALHHGAGSSAGPAGPADRGAIRFDAVAHFNVTGAKYVLVKKAELWRANCFEHVYFRTVGTLSGSDIDAFMRALREVIEPEVVRGGGKYPPKDHMYTFVTAVLIADTLAADTGKAGASYGLAAHTDVAGASDGLKANTGMADASDTLAADTDIVHDALLCKIRRTRFVKNYLFTIRGYCELRLVVFDLGSGEIYCNRAAQSLRRGLLKANVIMFQ